MCIRRDFYNRATNSRRDVIAEFLQLLHEKEIPYCVIGGVALNAYCEPIITLDFDCVVELGWIDRLKSDLREKGFKIRTHPHTWELRHKDSDIVIQLQRDGRYQGFIRGARMSDVLGYRMRVARRSDILKGKIWAYEDPERDSIKREKDLLDIKRLIQRYPKLAELLTEAIRTRLSHR